MAPQQQNPSRVLYIAKPCNAGAHNDPCQNRDAFLSSSRCAYGDGIRESIVIVDIQTITSCDQGITADGKTEIPTTSSTEAKLATSSIDTTFRNNIDENIETTTSDSGRTVSKSSPALIPVIAGTIAASVILILTLAALCTIVMVLYIIYKKIGGMQMSSRTRRYINHAEDDQMSTNALYMEVRHIIDPDEGPQYERLHHIGYTAQKNKELTVL